MNHSVDRLFSFTQSLPPTQTPATTHHDDAFEMATGTLGGGGEKQYIIHGTRMDEISSPMQAMTANQNVIGLNLC